MNRAHTKKLVLGCLVTLPFIAQNVLAHGYISKPASRSYQCKLGENLNCGAIQWEPQSVEGPDRYPEGGPADGKIASAGVSHFSELDEQSVNRWKKTPIQAGSNTFMWSFTANHATRDWRYYITKEGWNPNAPLTRNSFEAQPFCSYDGNNQRPPTELSHECNVPSRSGYQVILGVWDVGDTVNSFYQVIDVDFGGGGGDPSEPQEWRDIGDINPSIDLQTGDQVKTRVFDRNGENPGLQTVLNINSADDGKKDKWPFLLATAINKESDALRAGKMNAKGDIVPAYGRNDVFGKADSDVDRVEIEIVKGDDGPVDPAVELSGLQGEYMIENGMATIDFTVSTNAAMNVSSYVYAPDGSAAGFGEAKVDNASHNFRIDIDKAEAGAYSLVVKGESEDGKVVQKTQGFLLKEDGGDTPPSGDYDYVFPESLSAYKAGTTVLAKDGKIYRCKPFPYSGWCTVYSDNANHYEPGVGAYWSDAWELVK
ncbi:N-acetylglucosamine-binding protein GbpA [Hahella sp. HN01]|uniref:N-acetylglucosamine-binding protein GbpA n=1 Tax=Hahella sp. HN01 TaxID=2847262 RepID=UPI001C1EA740|nr:N-acetylglucosamine-binding protein GbpA [Hahella sp. HN01]MBU6953238.1 N-acetylglucosamine-binding protein GbpA [Hahella sp. HN01]